MNTDNTERLSARGVWRVICTIGKELNVIIINMVVNVSKTVEHFNERY